MSDKPLAGLKVVELGTLIAGPYCARLMAEFGADVVKIEDPASGDPLRQWRGQHDGTSLWWFAQARNKKSVGVDLRRPEGQEIVRRLAAEADIVIENFRPGTMENWNLGWEALSALNPRLIMVRLSGYGQTGPYRDQVGFGVVGEAFGGLRNLTGEPDQAPVRVGVSIGDTLAAMYGVIGALMALHHRDMRGGRGQVVDVALYEAVFSVLEGMLPEYAMLGTLPKRFGSAVQGVAPSNTYPCGGGDYIVIAGNSDPIFKRFMRAIGRADLADDPALARNGGRVQRQAELDAAIGQFTSAHPIDTVLAVLREAQVPCSKIYTPPDMLKDPHYAARQMIERFALKDGAQVTLPGIVPKLSGTPGATEWVGPALGAHTEEVLLAAGYRPDEIASLRERKVI